VDVTGATVTVDKYAMALLRVSTRAGRVLSGDPYQGTLFRGLPKNSLRVVFGKGTSSLVPLSR
jgi:hypothetical protein